MPQIRLQPERSRLDLRPIELDARHMKLDLIRNDFQVRCIMLQV